MSRLLSEIKQQSEAAAAALEEAELLTDSDIQSLTREELNELLPGNEKFKLRRTIFKIIHKEKPVDQLLKELKKDPCESLRAALTNNGAIGDYLHTQKTQINHAQNSLPGPSTSDASDEMKPHTGPTGGYPQGPQSTSPSATDGPGESHNGQSDGIAQGAQGTGTLDANTEMDVLTGQTGGYPQGQQSTSTSATGGPVQSVNVQTDGGPKRARDSFPGTGTSGAGGQTVFLTGQTGTSTSATDDPMKSHHGPTDCGPQGARGTSTSATGGPEEFVIVQTDGSTQRAQDSYSGTGTSGAGGQTLFHTGQTGKCTSATGDPMDSLNGPTDGGSKGTSDSLPGPGTLYASGEKKPHTGKTGGYTQGSQNNFISVLINDLWHKVRHSGTSTSATGGPEKSLNVQTDGGSQGARAKLKYRMVVSGKTFGAHLNLMQRLKNQVQNRLQLDESSQDHEITFLFCPICSRIASDVEAAMTDVKDDKPVILVLMHHTREVKYTSSLKTWRDDNKVVLFINVFYHETIQGLLNCEENNAAVSKIQKDLLERFFLGSID